ncbi:CbtB-domain containing protein [Chelatococcus sambhunathii]|uniref:CbtB-domain containing protein n=1 Tax=Chelatococcus sambhunathii TaxID=363953 RepID=A0ABU1DF98_9HYPH|nr:CbtB domain-containing protein [Chelatococcus sambhunathii]MDR4306803.1 CbtB-domain containing protein [Chelatococcus sambhunathii]
MTTASTFSQTRARSAQARLAAAFAAFTLGALVVFTVGFAGPEMIHNAAHDARHATGFPCH